MAAKSKGLRDDNSRGQSNRSSSGDEQRNLDTSLNRESTNSSDDLEDLRNTSTSGFASIEDVDSTEDDLDIEKSDLENLEDEDLEDEDLEDVDLDEDDADEAPYDDQYEDADEDADETNTGKTGARGMDV